MKSQFLAGLTALVLSLFATQVWADCVEPVRCGGQWVPASPQVAYAPAQPAYGYGQTVYVLCGPCSYAPAPQAQAYAPAPYPQTAYMQPVYAPQAYAQPIYAQPCLPCQGQALYAPPQEVSFNGDYEGGVGGGAYSGYGGGGGGGPEIAQVTGYGNISGFVGSHANGSAGGSTTTTVNVSASAYANAQANAYAHGGGHGRPGHMNNGCGCHRPPPPPRPCGCGRHH